MTNTLMTAENKHEIWKDIKEYEGLYQISSKGRVKMLYKKKKNHWGGVIEYPEKILSLAKQQSSENTVYWIGLRHKDGFRKMVRVDKLMIATFGSTHEK